MKKGEKKVKNLPAVSLPKDLAKQFAEDAKENLQNVHDAFYHISIQGSRYQVNGQLIGDKGTEFEAIILKETPVNVYYTTAFDKSNPISPDCWSLGGLKPDPSSKDKQSTSCVTCKANRFGSLIGQDGKKRKGKACHNTRRLILKVMGVDMPVVMSLPPTSIKLLNAYLKNLTSGEIPIPVFAVKTIFEFDSSVQYPRPMMKKGDLLKSDEYASIKQYRISQEVMDALNAYASPDDYESSSKGEQDDN